MADEKNFYVDELRAEEAAHGKTDAARKVAQEAHTAIREKLSAAEAVLATTKATLETTQAELEASLQAHGATKEALKVTQASLMETAAELEEAVTLAASLTEELRFERAELSSKKQQQAESRWNLGGGVAQLQKINERVAFQSALRKSLVAATVDERDALAAEVEAERTTQLAAAKNRMSKLTAFREALGAQLDGMFVLLDAELKDAEADAALSGRTLTGGWAPVHEEAKAAAEAAEAAKLSDESAAASVAAATIQNMGGSSPDVRSPDRRKSLGDAILGFFGAGNPGGEEHAPTEAPTDVAPKEGAPAQAEGGEAEAPKAEEEEATAAAATKVQAIARGQAARKAVEAGEEEAAAKEEEEATEEEATAAAAIKVQAIARGQAARKAASPDDCGESWAGTAGSDDPASVEEVAEQPSTVEASTDKQSTASEAAPKDTIEEAAAEVAEGAVEGAISWRLSEAIEALDKDGDGMLTSEELGGTAGAAEAVAALDTDGDQKLSSEELKAAAKTPEGSSFLESLLSIFSGNKSKSETYESSDALATPRSDAADTPSPVEAASETVVTPRPIE